MKRPPLICNSEISDSEINLNRMERVDFDPSVKWRGRSGRQYALVRERLENFVLKERDLYIIAEGNDPRWIGTAGDLITNDISRARFKEAVKVASCVLRLPDIHDELIRMSAAWDIEGGHLSDGKKPVGAN